jgi:hypothetical protein
MSLSPPYQYNGGVGHILKSLTMYSQYQQTSNF